LSQLWGAVYAALAAVFVWAQSNVKQLSWSVTLLGIASTLLFWIADLRNRPAIYRTKHVGADIEGDAASGIPNNQRFFAGLEEGISHSTAINIFAIVMLLLLTVATAYLFCRRGELPR
jgi:4-hydroxybenzoate polyprenyltransferase